jgi:cation diffusion facilitator CzcD-associated flavoprotein CzcO
MMPVGPELEVAVVGAGFSGLGAAIAVQRAGIEDYAILEAGDGVGGAWHWNTYPGVAVDIPSFSYQFSYAQRHDWSRVYAPGQELKAYAEDLVERFGLRPKLRLNTLVQGLEWEDEHHYWTLALAGGGSTTARHVIGAAGVFFQPKPPAIPGVEDFQGEMMHTARWDHSVSLRGKRVGIIGTGASAVQVVPSIAPEVAQLTVFQRTPIWCLPKPDRALPAAARLALGRIPGLQAGIRALSQTYVELLFPLPAHFAGLVPITALGERQGRAHLKAQVKDPVVRDKLTPRYSLGCKRPGFSNDYLRTFNRENVFLETDRIDRITTGSVHTATGAEHELDILITATGFKVFESGNMPPYPVHGADGLDLESFWHQHRFQAYEGLTVPGFPNLYTILAPYGFNGASYFTLIENQSRHIVRLLKAARRRGATRIEVTPEANERYFRKMLGRRHNQVFFQGGCDNAHSYYFDQHGDVPFRASPTLEVAWRSARFQLGDYAFA